MARTFRDLIVKETDSKPRVTLFDRTGTAVLQDVSVEVSSPIQQQGDTWGAREASLLLEIGDDGLATPIKTNPHRTTAEQTGALPVEKAQAKEDAGLATASKTVVGAINELDAKIDAQARSDSLGKIDCGFTFLFRSCGSFKIVEVSGNSGEGIPYREIGTSIFNEMRPKYDVTQTLVCINGKRVTLKIKAAGYLSLEIADGALEKNVYVNVVNIPYF